MLPRGSWGRGACYTEKLALKDRAWEGDGSRGCCLGSVGEQGHRSALAGKTSWWRWHAESPAWFPGPRYASEKSLVKLEGQTAVRFVLSVVMSVFFFSSFVSCS